MSTAAVSRRLQAEGLPVELVRGEGYHWFMFDSSILNPDAPLVYETESVMVPRFRAYSVDRWVEFGREFAAKVLAEREAEEGRHGVDAAERADRRNELTPFA